MFKQSCQLLAQKKLSIFFLESASAGYLSYQFSLSPFSGDILMGSLVCYNLKVKEKVLKISPAMIKKYSAESTQVTKEMIRKGKKIFKSDIYISCTGLLKPGGSETKEKPVGSFFYCIEYKNKTYTFKQLYKGTPEKKLEKLLNDICTNIVKIIKEKDK
ncbi:CinA family protein [Acinetobacter calcoaceticus]|uniref:CinA family protein n=1 Tax=Acinetobacter calcoaceticus TaxID=471 RepID=UPI002B287322|nr:nicotinamide-nucleotide amidohydrolase family protein [Acinetobacter baumannii]